jgi:hypothetical protein
VAGRLRILGTGPAASGYLPVPFPPRSGTRVMKPDPHFIRVGPFTRSV